MINIIIIVIVSIFFLFLIYVLVSRLEFSRVKEKQSRFSNRISIPVNQIYEKYYRGSELDKKSFIENWEKAASLLKLDSTLLRPDDNFDKELAPVKGSITIDETEELDFMLLDYCKKKGIKRKELKIPKTFGEFIKIITDKKF